MSIVDYLENDANTLLIKQSASLDDLRKVLKDVEDALATDQFAGFDEQDRLMTIRDDLKRRISELKKEKQGNQPPPEIDDEPFQPVGDGHHPEADGLMNQAEAAFYACKYGPAVALYDKVLKIEPTWERAKDHRAEAEKYMREGPPDVALPEEAAIHFGKAQSAVRVKNYPEARGRLAAAMEAIKAAGILRWNTGIQFSEKLDLLENAENAYREGLEAFRGGNLDDAIEKAETAYQAFQENKYKEKAAEWRTLKSDLADFNQVLSAGQPTSKVIAEKKAKLDQYITQYGEIPNLVRARTQLQLKLPAVEEMMFEEVRSKKNQAERANTIDEAIVLAKQAQQNVRNLQELGSTDDRLPKIKTDIDQLVNKLEGYENTLNQADQALNNNPRWPAEAWKLSTNIRRQFHSDPKVIELTRSLSFYNAVRNLISGVVVLVGIGILVLLAWLGVGWVGDAIKALTPTATPTFTATFTPSPTVTLTPIPTSTGTPIPSATPVPSATITPLPSPTATPVFMYTRYMVYARQDCYESYPAVDRIPEGAKVTLLPVEMRRDTLGRTCLLVEYRSDIKTVTGWVLLVDLQP